ncbi:VOC family protein [Actinoplanes sp. RD1]|uniref:VOC family protein n=1 Tax=Actinoplanes sp. RD1 TaxID=3064538 RepID=UPI0027418BC3|nr:VOC family protein [Actinoplanes sp. RD1]
MGISKLGYVGLDVTDVAAWADLFDRTLGVGSTREKSGPDEAVLLELDDFTYRLALYRSAEDRPRHIGWVVDRAAELERLTQRLTGAGFVVKEAPADEAAVRGAVAMRWFTDPAGFRVELALGEKRTTRPRRPVDATPGVTGLGHLVVPSPKLAEMRELYESVLEFKLTDYRAPGLFFFRCNSTHHSIALGTADTASIHHLEIEHGSIDDIGRAFDRAQANQVPISISLGRHMNDKAISFYVRNPSGFHLEIGYGAIEVGDDYVPHDFGMPSVWGHKHAQVNPFSQA